MKNLRLSAGLTSRRQKKWQRFPGSIPPIMTIGTEHEFSINDSGFTPQPVSDQILREVCGRYESEILFGEVKLGKELQKTVLEMIPRHPAEELAALEAQLVKGMGKFNHIFGG